MACPFQGLHETHLDDHKYMSEPEQNSPSAQKEKPEAGVGSSTSPKACFEDKGQHAEPPGEVEIGGRGGLEPTRFGDWEKNGRCTDF